MYEIFEDDNKKIYETGNIMFADLILRIKVIHYIFLRTKKIKGITILMEKVLKRL